MVWLLLIPIGGILLAVLLKSDDQGNPEPSDAYVVGEVYEGDVINVDGASGSDTGGY